MAHPGGASRAHDGTLPAIGSCTRSRIGKDAFEQSLWQVQVRPDKEKELTETSAVAALPLRDDDKQRFVQKQKLDAIFPGITNIIMTAQLPKSLNF